MYPLEPRELDPSAFFQLHTADSQEELQEFLLLESECMGDSNRGRGLASAFVSPIEDAMHPFLPSTKEREKHISNVSYTRQSLTNKKGAGRGGRLKLTRKEKPV
ncbi:hypothetical protein NQ317_000715 [Molorchus minor]|uniref:Uncharacterized protein n=1 Tax=Molorchus minor TaxID=1323400 RepID=A0ABQ9JFP1_9CUCU|nr:hypothetical protein NQ317_000715 [Molorchus minor]